MDSAPIALLGVPYDDQSSFARGSAKAPPLIRAAWHSESTNKYSEDLTLIDDSLVWDAGDIGFGPGEDPFSVIEREVGSLLDKGLRPICLGGDHSVSYPIVKAIAGRHRNLSILHFDAHPDLYQDYEGNRFSHACPFARIMEDGLAKRLVQVGIRSMTRHQLGQAERFGVEMIDMRSWDDDKIFNFAGPVHISFDIDALDPAFAPGVSHRQPGGLSTRQAINLIQKFEGTVVGADIVEFNPDLDVPGMTDAVCAKVLKEIAARMAHR
ncbi:MAG TPA: agmatinase [Thermoplasmata archaeon]|nr:agmatinase [Thermoplasmata archaeon]